jgi:hypothetical protein
LDSVGLTLFFSFMLLYSFNACTVTSAETRLLNLNSLPPAPGSDPVAQKYNAHLVERRENVQANRELRETELGNAIIAFLSAGGSKEDVARMAANVPSGELDAFLGDQTRQRLATLVAPEYQP